ncbi:hypothetical protein NCC78_03875 [Micromonospora phytophila]|uniref:hypothetical protein n=1 Tax=Micromonospora phytophila TaxID=709888 RepID=UPI002030128C|nr:hypothetical protein [Micromonospora phytophila]MCM0673846.1 hypothetical protein [Micromonospora phytophila]
MTDRRADEATGTSTAGWLRVVVTVLSAAVAGPVLLLYGWLLLWFSPEITNPGRCARESGEWGPDNGTFVWVVACAAGVAGALCFGLALRRMHRGGRWWPWLLAAAVFLAAGLPVVGALSSAAWCPPAP